MKTKIPFWEKLVSIIIVVVLAVELLPSNIAAGISQASETTGVISATEEYLFEAPYASDNTVTAEIPPTIIDGSVEESDPMALLAQGANQNDRRFIDIMLSGAAYSELTPNDAEFLCGYTLISDSDFAVMEMAGINLPRSIDYGSLANGFACPVEGIIELDLSAEQMQALSGEIAMYNHRIRDDLKGSDLDTELRGYILQGFTFEQVMNAYGISQLSDIDMSSLLDEDMSVNSADNADIEAIAIEFGVDAKPLSDYIADNGIEAYELDSLCDDVENAYAELLTSTVYSTGDGDEDDETIAQADYVSAPYMYNYGDNENVSLNTGALVYNSVDYVLPGRNGLDLTISRRYDSQSANAYLPGGTVWFVPDEIAYFVFIQVEGYFYHSGIGSGRWPAYDDTQFLGPFSTYSEALTALNGIPSEYVHENYSEDGTDLILKVVKKWISTLQSESGYYSYGSTTKANNYLNDLYGLGHGWTFAFSSIEKIKNDSYLHLADGGTYELDFSSSANASHLKDYTLADMVIEENITEYSNGSESSQYRLTYKDGYKEYFSSDGKLIGMVDKYGNTIKLVHTTSNGYPKITITDTLDRQVVISSTSTSTGHKVEVSLPSSVKLSYDVVDQASYGLKALSTYTNAVGCETEYSYTIQSAGFDVYYKNVGGATNRYLNLTTITHPTGAQSEYNYEVYKRNLGSSGLMQVYKLASRRDKQGTSTFNKLVYSYSSNDCSGYPGYSNPDSLPSNFTYTAAITDAKGVVSTYSFNNDNLNTSVSVTYKDKLLRETIYEYNSGKLPTKVTYRQYGSDGTTYMESIEAAEYDSKGNTTASWSTCAGGSTTDTEYKTTYTYDSAYGVLLTQSYKTDANTTVEIQNTLDSTKKNITSTKVYVNGALKQRTDYTYDTYGNALTQRKYNDGFITYNETSYTYDRGAYLSQEKHSDVKTFDNDLAAATPGQSAGTIVTQYAYDTLGRLTSYTDGNGNMTSYTYDNLGNVTKVTKPDDSTVVYVRDYNNNTLTVTDELGNAVKYTYTPLGLDFETVDVTSGKVIEHYDYDSMSRVSSYKEYVNGSTTKYAYDTLGRTESKTVYEGSAKELSKILYAYDDAASSGTYQKVTTTVVGDSTAPSVVTTQYTDNNGNVVRNGKLLNGTEYLDTYTYDYVGRVLTERSAKDAQNGLAYTTKYEYNENGQAVKIYNADGQYVTNTYNALGQLVTATDYAETPTIYAYDAMGRLISQTITVEDGVWAATKYAYDASGNLITELTPVNAAYDIDTWAKTEYAYDSRGNLTSVAQYDGDAVASVTKYTYDEAGNMLSMTTGLTSLTTDSGGSTTSYTYDRFGNVRTETDALGNTKTNSYSELGRLESTRDRKVQTIAYSYDALGRVTKTSDGALSIVRTYTLTGQVASESVQDVTVTTPNPNPGHETMSANPSTEIKTTTLYNKTEYVYDCLGRVTDSNSVDGKTVSTIYTGPPRGELTSTGDGTDDDSNGPGQFEQQDGEDISAISISNIHPNVTTTIYNKYASEYTYDLANNRTGFKLVQDNKNLQKVTYSYDDLNRLSTVTENGTTQAEYTYNANGSRESVTYANGVTETYSYNKANWVTGITNKKGDTVLSSFAYTYYASGNQHTMTDAAGVKTTYIYDTLGRLIEEAEDNGVTLSYTYDANGNRTKLTATGTENYITNYTYDAANRLRTSVKTENGAASTTSYTYDANGNTLEVTGPDHTKQYTYNVFNQVISAKVDGLTANYAYNARGIRVSKSTNIVKTTYFFLDGGNVVAEKENITLTGNYVWGANLVRDKEEGSYYLYNAHGDVIGLTDAGGTVTKSYDYDAFGNEKAPDANDANPFRYCGEYFDRETGAYYLRARYYDPVIGRFTQQDSHWNTSNMVYGDSPANLLGQNIKPYAPRMGIISQAGNLYVYCVNNPVMYSDPGGQDAIYIADYELGGGLPFFAHAALLFEYNGKWCYTEFSGKTPWNATIKLVDDSFKSESAVYTWLETEFKNAEYMRLVGDYSACYDLAKKYEGTDYGGYNLFNNNCLHYVKELLRAGKNDNTGIQSIINNPKYIIPATFYRDLHLQGYFAEWIENNPDYFTK